ncbi:hypothetical protein GDO81_022689 [Engystomops pustulosus]|uniref:Uncharacterized protein n=1 Tax=Engystomops pustulosus TaxID=76066 RepID=A0AAV6Z496_ENGPU|nr:hypothetical protein GDO81_022689 [Engystomops pustulosus]
MEGCSYMRRLSLGDSLNICARGRGGGRLCDCRSLHDSSVLSFPNLEFSSNYLRLGEGIDINCRLKGVVCNRKILCSVTSWDV